MVDSNELSGKQSGFSDVQPEQFEHFDHSGRISKEFSIWEVLKTLSENCWPISGILIITVLCSLIAFFFVPFKKEGTVSINSISASELQNYRLLNEVTESKGDLEVPILGVSENSLMLEFVYKLRERDVFIEALEELQIINRADYVSELDYNNAVRKEAYNIQIIPPDVPDSRRTSRPVKTSWTISYEHDDEELVRNLLFSSVEKANLATQKAYQKLFQQIKNQMISRSELKVSALQLEQKLIIDEYNRETENRIADLLEQAAVARSLGIDKNTLPTIDVGGQGSVVNIPQTNSIPLFFRGYVALEKELNLIKSRESNLPFVSGLQRLITSEARLNNNNKLVQFQNAYDLSPFEKDDFSAVQPLNSVYAVSIKSSPLRFVIPALIGLLGIFVVIVYLAFLVVRRRATN